MKPLFHLILSASALAFAVQSASAGETWPPPLASDASLGAAAEGPSWLGSMGGEKLVAVDGSTLTLSSSEGGLSLALVSQNGAAQKSSLAFMSDKLGTISDNADAGHVTGFFRETDNGLEAQFADGRTESLVANTAGGISLTIHASTGETTCTSWYPTDHNFSAVERKAAVDAYAAHLGLAQKSRKAAHMQVCVPAIRVVHNKIAPGATRSMIVVTHPDLSRPRLATDIALKSSTAAGLIPVVVRTSDVHLIDGPVPSPAGPPAPASMPAKAPAAAPLPQPAATIAPQQTALASPVSAGAGASDCLSVETDGANLGFRNRCGYGVQFAYCLQRASDAATACDAGSKTGAVSANGFAAVLADTNIKAADAEHDFRWVACSGNPGDVIAHLERSDPPMGRCTLSKAL